MMHEHRLSKKLDSPFHCKHRCTDCASNSENTTMKTIVKHHQFSADRHHDDPKKSLQQRHFSCRVTTSQVKQTVGKSERSIGCAERTAKDCQGLVFPSLTQRLRTRPQQNKQCAAKELMCSVPSSAFAAVS